MNILQNPFYILGATPRDNRQKIMELAQEKSLSLDSEITTEARLTLTTPRKRIAAEIAWFPGVSNKKANELIKSLDGALMEPDAISSLPALAGINVTTTMLATLQKGTLTPKKISDILYRMAVDFESIDTEKLMKILNEDRSVAGISEITEVSAVDSELREHKLSCIKIIQDFLRNVSLKQMTIIMLTLVNKATQNRQQLELIDGLVDNVYALNIQKERHSLEESIKTLRQEIKTNLAKKTRTKASTVSLVDKFREKLVVFDEIMQPIQVSMQQRGLEHDDTRRIADEARECAIDLISFGEKELSEQVLVTIKELFAELGSVEDRADRDLAELQEIKNKDKEWEKSITCKIEQSGFWQNHSLEISPKCIKEDGDFICKLEDVNAIRYGTTAKYTNGIYNGTDTLLAFSTEDNETVITWLEHKTNWVKAADCLWRGVGLRLILAMANELARGGNIYEIIYDTKVKLAKNNTWGPVDEKFFKWSEVRTSMVQGHFIIAAKDGSGYTATLSVQGVDNVHVADALLSIYFSKGGPSISQALGITKEQAKKEKRIHLSDPVSLQSYSFLWSWFWVAVGIFVLIIWAANS
jgi:hypothetical protein